MNLSKEERSETGRVYPAGFFIPEVLAREF
jgi:hypothetical protein